MDPQILTKDRIILAGFSFYGDPFEFHGGWTEENEIGRLWQRFIDYLSIKPEILDQFTDEHVGYEVHIEHSETKSKGLFEVFVGQEIISLENLPVELLVKVIPPTTYAVFTLQGEQMTSDWYSMIYKGWLPASGYQTAFDFSFQLYDQRFKGMDRIEESSIDLYVPILNKDTR